MMSVVYDLRLVVLLNVMATVMSPEMSCSVGRMEVSRAKITCHFGTNIKESRQSFTILRYPLDTTEFDSVTGTRIAACSWQQEDGQLQCYEREGYKFNKSATVTTTATLYTDTLTKDHGGIYECQVGPGSNPVSAAVPTCNQRCILAVPDDVVNTTPSVCGECGQTDCNESGLRAGFAVLVVIVIIFIATLIVFVILLKRIHGTNGVYKEVRGLFTRRELDTTAATEDNEAGSLLPTKKRSTPEGTEDKDKTTPFTDNTGSASQPEAPKRRTKENSAARSKETQSSTDHTVVVNVPQEVPKPTTTNAGSQTSPTETKTRRT